MSFAHSEPISHPRIKSLEVLLGMAALGFLLIGAFLLPIPMLYWYDDGVYFLGAVRIVAGDRPYSDFYLAHPPGVTWMTAIVVKLGGGIVASRAVFWSLAAAFAVVFARFLERVQVSKELALSTAWLGVFMLSATRLYMQADSQILTHLPGMTMTLIGFFFLLPGRLSPVSAGLWLASATVFRIQFAFVGPAWVAFLLATYGWSAGRGPILRLAGTALLALIAFHGGMQLLYSDYFKCVLMAHLGRTTTPLGEKFGIFADLFREPQIAFGLIASAILATTGRGATRGLGAFALAEVTLTLIGSRFLMEAYFLPTYPYMLGNGALFLAGVAEQKGAWRVYLPVILVVATLSGIPLVRTASYRLSVQRSFEEDLIQRVRFVPGRTVACTAGKIPYYAGKQLVNDYLCPDTTSPINSDFGPWFVSMVRRADLAVITDSALKDLKPADCREIVAVGRPIIFGTPVDEAEFRRRTSEGTR